MALPTTAGQKVTCTFTDQIFTVGSFFGESGIEYKSFYAAQKANPKGLIYVKNKEHGGVMAVEDCTVIVGELVPNLK